MTIRISNEIVLKKPTPVSSLLHAATLVTAGVYLLLRSSSLLALAPRAQVAVVSVGALTALFAASTGLVQNDIKRVIAFSTCSQIGYMIAAVGLGRFDLALFHLVNHAFFKALLFLGAGGVLHSLTNNQDIRYQGGGLAMLPVTYVARTVGSLALVAFPFRSGRYSKELLINNSGFGSYSVYIALLLAAAFTAFYSVRLLAMAFFGRPRFIAQSVHEVSMLPTLCYIALGLCAMFFGFVRQDAFVGAGSDRLAMFSHETPGHLEGEFNHPLLPRLFTGLGALAYLSGLAVSGTLYNFLIARWALDEAFSLAPARTRQVSGFLRKELDRGALELVGPRGLGQEMQKLSQTLAAKDPAPVTQLATLILTRALLGSLLY